MRGNPSGERRAAQPSGRPHEPAGDRRTKMDGHPRRSALGRDDGTELGLQTASLTWIPTARAERVQPGQSSSGRKMCGAVQALQIGVADSRSPNGIGSFRSGNRHSTS